MRPTHRPPTSPSQMLRLEFLHPRGLTERDAATLMGISIKQLNDLMRYISADTAMRLAKLLDTTPEFWMNLQEGQE